MSEKCKKKKEEFPEKKTKPNWAQTKPHCTCTKNAYPTVLLGYYRTGYSSRKDSYIPFGAIVRCEGGGRIKIGKRAHVHSGAGY